MEHSGWIKLHRKIMDSNMYKSFNAVQRDIMIQCLLLANHSHNKWLWEGKLYECQPGQFITSLDSLQKHCAKGTSVGKIRNALKIMQKWEFITNKSTKTGRLITICNWEIYQTDNFESDKQTNKEATKKRQRSNKEATTNKNDIRINKNDKEIYIEHFEKLWEIYPRKYGKKEALKHMSATIKNKEDVENCNLAIDNYIAEIKRNKTEEKFIKHGSTFFNNWRDWIPEKKDVNEDIIILKSHIPEGAV